jgi:hypothetical protein
VLFNVGHDEESVLPGKWGGKRDDEADGRKKEMTTRWSKFYQEQMDDAKMRGLVEREIKLVRRKGAKAGRRQTGRGKVKTSRH